LRKGEGSHLGGGLHRLPVETVGLGQEWKPGGLLGGQCGLSEGEMVEVQTGPRSQWGKRVEEGSGDLGVYTGLSRGVFWGAREA
jgi:hypothetical protein